MELSQTVSQLRSTSSEPLLGNISLSLCRKLPVLSMSSLLLHTTHIAVSPSTANATRVNVNTANAISSRYMWCVWGNTFDIIQIPPLTNSRDRIITAELKNRSINGLDARLSATSMRISGGGTVTCIWLQFWMVTIEALIFAGIFGTRFQTEFCLRTLVTRNICIYLVIFTHKYSIYTDDLYIEKGSSSLTRSYYTLG